jgi:deoxycytidylate deaminase
MEEIIGALIALLRDIPGTEAQPAGRPASERKAQAEDPIKALEIAGQYVSQHRGELQERLRTSRIGGLIEFSRAIHAEMDALLSAARQGISPVGSRMFVTTFPCHSCARHLVGAGVDEVQYIEPYPKSKALSLHKDAITTDRESWRPPSQGGTKVLFRPFTGAAPSLYARAFLKERELKHPITGILRMADPDWGTPWDIKRSSYAQLEAELLKEEG